ncbi:hypothetical protein TCAL_15131 [Tigriopus californicus]|uniref:Uncharacterized protein n=1 Tax=Tigriopus californicus TaxID=6832 RepID=A0A553NTY9_TIGCA|nr:hypothetical protein TCAL_15131 [Tigriopus californicus]
MPLIVPNTHQECREVEPPHHANHSLTLMDTPKCSSGHELLWPLLKRSADTIVLKLVRWMQSVNALWSCTQEETMASRVATRKYMQLRNWDASSSFRNLISHWSNHIEEELRLLEEKANEAYGSL